MYRKQKISKSSIELNDSQTGETIEMKMERVMNNNEPISDGAPIIFTERKDGVRPEYNPRTDRFEVAIEAMDKVAKTHIGKREERQNLKIVKPEDGKPDGKPEPTQGTQQ